MSQLRTPSDRDLTSISRPPACARGGSDATDFSTLVARNAQAHPTSSALRHKRRGLYRTWSWSELDANVSAVARGLQALGFCEGSVLLTISEIKPEWIWTVLAAHRLGGSVLPLSPDAAASAWRDAFAHTRVRFVLADSVRELERVREYKRALARNAVILHTVARGVSIAVDASLRSVEAVRHLGECAGEHDVCPVSTLAPAFIALESRSDGAAERHVTHHASLIDDARASRVALSSEHELWLDPSLGFGAETLVGIARWLLSSALLGLGEGPTTRQADRRELGPTHIVAASSWYDALWTDTESRLPRRGSLARVIVDWALKVGAGASGGNRFGRALAKLVVLWPLADALGLSRVQLALSAGRPPDHAVRTLFDALSVPLVTVSGSHASRDLAGVPAVALASLPMGLRESEGV